MGPDQIGTRNQDMSQVGNQETGVRSGLSPDPIRDTGLQKSESQNEGARMNWNWSNGLGSEICQPSWKAVALQEWSQGLGAGRILERNRNVLCFLQDQSYGSGPNPVCL
jgi:hypothetical protein